MVERVEKTKKGDAIDMPNESVLVEETSVDWRGRPCKPNKHGGMTAAVFVLGLRSPRSPIFLFLCCFNTILPCAPCILSLSLSLSYMLLGLVVVCLQNLISTFA